MTVELSDTRKVCVISWDTSVVQGKQASIQAAGEEKRTTENDGQGNVYFPLDWSGEVEITVAGSKSGEDHGTISVS
jgi:spore coat protein CotH